MLRDAEYFRTKLGGMDGARDTGDYIVNLVKGKSVPNSKSALSVPKKEAVGTNGRTRTSSESATSSRSGKRKEVADDKAEKK